MKISMEPSGAGPLGRFFFTAVLLSIGLLILVQLCLPPELKVRCLFFQWTGLPCFTCGATRCLQHVMAGNFLPALQTQPLVFAAVFLGGFILVCRSLAELLRLPILCVRFESSRERMLLTGGLAVIVLLNWVYLIVSR